MLNGVQVSTTETIGAPKFRRGTPMAVGDALTLLLDDVQPLSETEQANTTSALGRILACPLHSLIDVPPSDNSAMDGYAVRSADLAGSDVTELPVVQKIAAGHTGVLLQPGTTARIFTGAPLPPGSDAVVMQERCQVEGERVSIRGPVKPGTNVRRAGEDVARGATILDAGLRLRPQDLALAASTGAAELTVFRKLRVATFFTGDELVEPGTPLAPGEIYNSVRYLLGGLVNGLGCEWLDMGTVPDDLTVTRQALQRAAREADLIVTSGGVSVGDEDYVHRAVSELGELKLWRVAIKPGKPLAYGAVNGVPVFGLPGNPVSAFVNACLFLRPYVLRQQGRAKSSATSYWLRAAFSWNNRSQRREYLRGRLVPSDQAVATVEAYDHQGSGILSSVSWADGLIMIPEWATVALGEPVEFLPFTELLY